MLARQWADTRPRDRPRPMHRGPAGPACEVERLTAAEAAANQAAARAFISARAPSLRQWLIESGKVVPLDARIADDGTTIFRNAAGAPVFRQGHLTRKMLAASHPSELEEHEEMAAPRNNSRNSRKF
jgi:hypothetical protein